jgi:pimeloyl-ACP methyl ester carboxylesterase
MRRKAHRARINGIELSYGECGKGEAVLFIHGSNVDERIWDDHGDILHSQYRVIALTQRYFGLSPWPDDGQGFSLATHALDLAAFVRTLHREPITLVGWSYGAAVCLVMATQHLQAIKRLFLYEPAIATFVSDPLERQNAQGDRLKMIGNAKAAASAGNNDSAVEMFMDGVNDEPGTFLRFPQVVQSMMLQNSRMLPLLFAAPPPPQITCEDLRRLEMPVTIALGAASRAFYNIAARSASGCIPHARLVVVPGARHMWPIQETRAFSQLVLDFLLDTRAESVKPGDDASAL